MQKTRKYIFLIYYGQISKMLPMIRISKITQIISRGLHFSFANQNMAARKAKTMPIFSFCSLHKGFYDWNNPQSYSQAMKDQYCLSDMIQGCKIISKQAQSLSSEQMAFIMYTSLIFAEKQSQLLPMFLPSFKKVEQSEGSHKIIPKYMPYVRHYCFQNTKKDRKFMDEIIPYLKRRVFHPQNRYSIAQIHQNLSNCCFQNMCDLSQIFADFKKLCYNQMTAMNFAMSREKVKIMGQTYLYLLQFDQSNCDLPFFSQFPQLYKKDEKAFQNLLQFLVNFLTSNTIKLINKNDIFELNKKISVCADFKSEKTKKLIKKYSLHLASIHRGQLINFNHLVANINRNH